jgi:hypothetical protein
VLRSIPMQLPTDSTPQASRQDLLSEALAEYARDAAAMLRVHRLAERHGSLPRGSFTAQELVTDVIEDMLLGDLTCDPQLSIGPQVEKYVQRRAYHLRNAESQPRVRGPRKSRRSARLRPTFVPLDDVPEIALAVDAPQHQLYDRKHEAIDSGELIARIREHARGDDPVEQLLALYDRKRYLRRDALEAGMGEWAYRTARSRLTQYGVAAISALAPSSGDPAPAAQGTTGELDGSDTTDAVLLDGKGRARRATRKVRNAR